MNYKKISNILLIVLSAVFLAVPALLSNFKPDQISVYENRKLAELVPISEGYNIYTLNLNSFINDRIGLREEMVRLYNKINVNFLKSRDDQVISGKDGWLFYAEDLPDYTGRNYSPEKVEYFVSVLKAVDEWCKANDSQFVFMMAPNKSSVYYEYMPEYIERAEITLYDTLSARLKEEGIIVIDPKAAMLEVAYEKEIYMRLDSHWNVYGAEYALDEMLEKLGLPKHEFEYTESRIKTGDMLSLLSLPAGSLSKDSLSVEVAPNPNCVRETNEETMCVRFNNPDGESFVCYRDSFTLALEDFYSYYFDGILYSNWHIEQTDEENFPKYFIIECLERHLSDTITNCSIIMDK